MFKLIPVFITTENFLILFFKLMAVKTVEILKRTASHRGCLHT